MIPHDWPKRPDPWGKHNWNQECDLHDWAAECFRLAMNAGMLDMLTAGLRELPDGRVEFTIRTKPGAPTQTKGNP